MKLPNARPLTIRERLRDGFRLANGELGILMEAIAKIAGRAEERARHPATPAIFTRAYPAGTLIELVPHGV
jgi:hypothetical protein